MRDYSDEERLSRREAAERLTDIAYGLTLGGPIEMTTDGHSVKLPVGDDLMLKRESTSKGGRTRLELELSWSTALVPDAPSPKPPRR
ncbi:MAG: amphi-Trp domain-containing protein [Solirubrobacterales bacterium]